MSSPSEVRFLKPGVMLNKRPGTTSTNLAGVPGSTTYSSLAGRYKSLSFPADIHHVLLFRSRLRRKIPRVNGTRLRVRVITLSSSLSLLRRRTLWLSQ